LRFSPVIESPPRVPRAAVLTLRRWGDDLVVFDGESGDTHLLSGLSGRILEALIRAPGSTEELDAALAGMRGNRDGELSSEQVARALADLRQLRLTA
jgi:PqqD family protein of HPr-rel-A system